MYHILFLLFRIMLRIMLFYYYVQKYEGITCIFLLVEYLYTSTWIYNFYSQVHMSKLLIMYTIWATKTTNDRPYEREHILQVLESILTSCNHYKTNVRFMFEVTEKKYYNCVKYEHSITKSVTGKLPPCKNRKRKYHIQSKYTYAVKL